jgi:hypothetical protein
MPDILAREITLENALTVALLTPLDDPFIENCRWGIPILIWGSPGIGKSDRLERACDCAGLPLETLYAAGHHPEDFTGVAVRKNEQGDLRRACVLDEVNRLCAGKRGVLFLDEIGCAPASVQAALLKVALKRYVGDTHLPGGVRIIAASNPPEEGTGGWELEPPLANRFIHFDEPPPTKEAWTRWVMTGGVNDMLAAQDGEALVLREWRDMWALATGHFCGFVDSAENIYNLPPVGSAARGRAWPSPRSVTYAMRLYCASMCLGLCIKECIDMVAAAVGVGWATSWAEWLSKSDLPTAAYVLEHGWVPDNKRLDRNMAVYASITAYVVNCSNEEEMKVRAVKAWKVLDSGAGVAADIVARAAHTLVTKRLGVTGGAKVAAAAKGVLAKLGSERMANIK